MYLKFNIMFERVFYLKIYYSFVREEYCLLEDEALTYMAISGSHIFSLGAHLARFANIHIL